jgi:hypothetical protein
MSSTERAGRLSSGIIICHSSGPRRSKINAESEDGDKGYAEINTMEIEEDYAL